MPTPHRDHTRSALEPLEIRELIDENLPGANEWAQKRSIQAPNPIAHQSGTDAGKYQNAQKAGEKS